MYICFFVEGSNEETLIEFLMRSCFPHIKQEKVQSALRTKPTELMYHIFNCSSVDRIPYDINEKFYMVRDTHKALIVICDTEKNTCFTSRKEKISERINNTILLEQVNDVDKVEFSKLFYTFNKTSIEQIYLDEIELTKTILRRLLNREVDDGIVNEILCSSQNSLQKIKNIFLSHEIHYQKVQFANKFFSQIDYINSNNKVIRRMVEKIRSLV